MFSIGERTAISLAFEKKMSQMSRCLTDPKAMHFLTQIFDFESVDQMALAQKIYHQAPEYWINTMNSRQLSIQKVAQIIGSQTTMSDFKRAQQLFSKEIAKICNVF